MNSSFPVPDEIALRILDFLPQKDLVKLSQVNRYFRRISRDDSLWTTITMDAMTIMIHEDTVRRLFRRCSRLETAVIKDEYSYDSYGLTNRTLSILAEAKSSLKNIQIAHTLLLWTPENMEALGQMQGLKSLNLTVGNVKQSQVLEHISRLTGLEILEMRCCSFSVRSPGNIQSMNAVFEALKNLRYIDFSPINAETLSCLVANNNKLQNLNLHRRLVTDESLKQIVQFCPDLQVLRIMNNSRALEILSSCVNLRSLSLIGDNECEEKFLTKLVENNKKLEHIVITGGESALVTEQGIQNMFAKAKSLKTFIFGHNAPQLGDGAGDRLKKKFPGVETIIV